MSMQELSDELRVWIGRESGPVRAPGPVEWSDVRRYMNATGDHHPMWGDADPDRNPARAGTLVPPAMILDVLRPPAGEDDTAESGERPFPSLGGVAGQITVPGERARLNAGTEIEWIRPLRIGDWVMVRFKILDIRCKETQSGPAVFITEERRYLDQAGEVIAVARQTTLRTLAASGTA
jgi:hydroxyacyl-ACP dehydratase HTD2-like protein with hotdog domain